MTREDAYDWVEYANEQGGQLTDREDEKVSEARRVIAKACGAPWYTYEGIGPEEGVKQ